MFVVTGVSGISPAQIGLVLTYVHSLFAAFDLILILSDRYTTSLTQMFGMVTRQSAELENNMNSVERVVQYSRGDLIEQEPAHDIDDKKPPPSWPDKGAIEFDDVVMRYRPGLPPVLKGVCEVVADTRSPLIHAIPDITIDNRRRKDWRCWTYRRWKVFFDGSPVPNCRARLWENNDRRVRTLPICK